jgi:hypothetical protein
VENEAEDYVSRVRRLIDKAKIAGIPMVSMQAGIAILPTLAVSYIGIHLKNRVNEIIFRRVVLVVVMSVGVMGMSSYFIKLFG